MLFFYFKLSIHAHLIHVEAERNASQIQQLVHINANALLAFLVHHASPILASPIRANQVANACQSMLEL
jgi:hypothetical protein